MFLTHVRSNRRRTTVFCTRQPVGRKTAKWREHYLIYDGQNRLVGKEVNETLTKGFLYDGQLESVAELDGSGNIVEQFVYGTRPNVSDYIVKGGVEYRVISDQVGSPVLIVNASTGAVAEQISYDAWGNITSDSNPGFQPFGSLIVDSASRMNLDVAR